MLKKNFKDNIIECGVDEAGRGPLLGRVYTAAVILPNNDSFDYSCIKDSKRFHSKNKLKSVFEYIIENAVSYHITFEDESMIDRINILQATIRSMHNSIKGLHISPEHILVDGDRFKPYSMYDNSTKMIKYIPHTCIKKGDNTYCSIAAASILAKYTRDQYIETLCKNNPDLDSKYGLLSNKGYGTKKHMEGIKQYGITKYHRKTFTTRLV